MDMYFGKDNATAQIFKKLDDLEKRIGKTGADFAGKSSRESALSAIEQVREGIARPAKTPLYVWSGIYALLTGGYVLYAALLCGQMDNCRCAIPMLTVITVVWGVVTGLFCRLVRSLSEGMRLRQERYDNLMNVLDERRIKLLDKEF